MTRQFDDLAHDAAEAVRGTTQRLDVAGGADDVRRRASRRALAPVVAGVVALVALAVPGIAWLSDRSEPVGVEVADAPDDTAPGIAGDDVDSDVGDVADVGDEGTNDTDPAPGGVDDGPDPVPDTPEPDTGPSALGTFGLDTFTSEGFPDGGTDVALLTDVRVAGQDGFDRFVLEFDGAQMSPYQVGYVDGPVRADGSGDVVELDGNAYLEVRLTAASGVVFDADAADGYRLTYAGPGRLQGGDTAVLAEVVRTGDFEATLTWTLGLDTRTPFAVTVLEAPLRLVIDMEAP